MTVHFDTLDALAAAVGQEFGPSDWITVSQERIDEFAEATGDRQWIHVDAERAAAGPYGTTIAHGFLTLALTVPMTAQVMTVGGISAAINYGLDRVRFLTPVPSGSRIRGTVTLLEVHEVEGGAQATRRVTVELEGATRPACVADAITRYVR
ncbi:MaoC family dehydratase [Nocardia camponoti]|uniref:Enoyl-CoA hydratase 1 n=1 Tax=Nocardia camponoti TaxID=1616106 RepID=A0A917Q9C2_9NOCA|nr:MaoC family dehydratase [Nocardia camponoti]GGK37350.1 putative enoyl-CoA hydratase 1 [Nocardia camponoti]